MFLVGLTGNYGAGKSTVLKMFGDLGAIVYDADEIVASLLREEAVIGKIRALLGEQIVQPDGSLDKKKIATVIFAHDALRYSLENILHPLVFEKISRLLEYEGGKGTMVVVETPLLFERQYEERFQKIITVQTAQGKAFERLEKKGIKQEDAVERMRSQLPLEEKIRRSDFVIDNDGTLSETEQQVREIYQQLLCEGHDGARCRS